MPDNVHDTLKKASPKVSFAHPHAGILHRPSPVPSVDQEESINRTAKAREAMQGADR